MDNKKLFGIIGVAASGFGLFLTLLFGAISCSFSANNVIEEAKFTGSFMYIAVVFGMMISIAGAVFAFLSMTKGEKPSIFVIIAFACTVAALIFGIIPHVTICAYNCSLKSSAEDAAREAYSSYSSWFN